jgi:hypothetical protein
MRPDTGDEASAHPSGKEGRAVCREERDRVVLVNPAFSLAFSTADGTLLSLHHSHTQTDLIHAPEAAADGFLWRLEVADESGDTITVTNRDCAEFTYSTGYHRRHGNLRLWLHWKGLGRSPEKLDGRVTAQVTFPPHAPTALFEAEIGLPPLLSGRSFTLPTLCAFRSPDILEDDALFLPLSGGILIPDPCSTLYSEPDRSWQVVYPGPASMQFFGYSCGGRTTVWLAAADPEGATKTMTASPMPRSSRLNLAFTHHPALRPDGLWSAGYPCVVGAAFGDWFEAAREYRAWAAEQPWSARGRGGERRLPALTSSYGLWTSHWGGARRAPAAARELQRAVNIPIKLDWRCWHACARNGAYPDYFPPRDGDRAFAAAKEQLGQAGVLAQLNLDGLSASTDSETWKADRAEDHALLLSEDDDSPSLSPSRPAHLSLMCPSTPYWRDKLSALARQAVEHGADGLYLEQLADTQPLVCRNPDHGHGAPTPSQWSAGIRTTLAAVRKAIGENIQLALDGPAELYLDLADVFFSHHPAAESRRLLSNQFGHRWSPIPLFSAVYHDYTTLIGPDVSLVNHQPYDPLWPRAAIADLRGPPAVMDRDYQAQFCLQVGRAAAWGQHPVLANFSPEQCRGESSPRKLAFLAAALRAQAWGVGALIPYSEFMGPLTIESSPVEIQLLVNPIDSHPSERRAITRSIQPVLGSAWRTPGSGLALVFVNINHHHHEFTARLRSSRLSPKLPLRLLGRTFSEDGDVPAVSLRTSGTEISGRLPGRCVVLISLR